MTQLEKIQYEIQQLPPKDIVDLQQWFSHFQMKALKEAARKGKTNHNLDHLAGTWSEEDAREFEEATADFGQIDEEMWF